MKNKRIIAVIALFLILLVVWLFWGEGKRVEEQPVVEAGQDVVQQEEPEKKPTAKSVAEYMQSPDADPAIIKRIKKVQKFQSLKTAEFSYYGKVIDQHGDPVVGASVQVDIGYYPFIPNGNFYPSHKILSLVTDAEGRFSIVGEKGESVRIDPIPNSEYDFSYPDLFALTFSRVGIKGLKKISDPANPVIFHAWKKAEAERLVFSPRLKYRYSFDSSPYTINLLQPESRKGRGKGDIIVSIWRDPNASRHDAGDWKISLESVGGGGLIETADTFMNEAPEEGYQPKIVISHKKSDNNYVSRADKKYYLKSRNGQVYASLEVQIRPYYNDRESVLIIKYWLNPTGSRNLQYDPSKRIRPR